MGKYFEYVYLESGIHCFKWLDMSANATSAYFDFIAQIYQNLDEGEQIVRILHDYRDRQFVPSSNIFPKARLLQIKYPHINRRIAYVSQQNQTEYMVELLTKVVKRSGVRRFFSEDQEQLAINWLLSDSE